MPELTKEEAMWLRLADLEYDLKEVTKKVIEVHNELREYSLVKDNKKQKG